MNDKVLILNDIRSAHNVGAILRNAACFGDFDVYCTGYTPYPKIHNDTRLPHEVIALSNKIAKTALGAEQSLTVKHHQDIRQLFKELKVEGYTLVGLEQNARSLDIRRWKPATKTALVLGNEPLGIDVDVLDACDSVVEIVMHGAKESLNVASATAIALFQWTL